MAGRTCCNLNQRTCSCRGESHHVVTTSPGLVKTLVGPAPHQHPWTLPSPSKRGHPQAPQPRATLRDKQRRWGGSTPDHPAALHQGMQMGFDPPEQYFFYLEFIWIKYAKSALLNTKKHMSLEQTLHNCAFKALDRCALCAQCDLLGHCFGHLPSNE
jgi:hypothetical protein